jgi:hypothetical protein
METRELFDSAVELERRLADLVAWIESRRQKPVEKPEHQLLASLLGAGAASVPLHLVFPDEPEMDLGLVNTAFVGEAEPIIEETLVAQFIWRHTHLTIDQIERLQEAEHRYHAIIGLTDWEGGFETRTQFEEAVGRYEVIIEKTPGGLTIHEDEVFWYVAARDEGFSREDADAYSRFHSLYLFLLGIATDDVGITVLEPLEVATTLAVEDGAGRASGTVAMASESVETAEPKAGYYVFPRGGFMGGREYEIWRNDEGDWMYGYGTLENSDVGYVPDSWWGEMKWSRPFRKRN